MTVSYSLEAASSNTVRFHQLMFRWRGSVWQTIWKELSLWCFFYAIVSVVYRAALNDKQQQSFTELALFCQKYVEYIPVTFMLGFYVNFVITRWWDQYNNLGWIDTTCLLIATYVKGSDEGARMVRRACARWLVLAQAMLIRDISPCIKKRFPTLQHLVDAELMTQKELETLKDLDTPHHKYFVSIQWCCTLLSKARDEGRIESDILLQQLIAAVLDIRTNLGTLFSYDWISVPLVYTQVVSIGVRSYFIVALIGRQYLLNSTDPDHQLDLYIPIFTILQFVFFVGWLKVAEVLINPLGEDEEDFELNYVLSRNISLGLTIVDDNYGVTPKLEKDAFWDEPSALLLPPHTEASSHSKPDVVPFAGSCADMRVSEKDQARVFPRAATGQLPRRQPMASSPSDGRPRRSTVYDDGDTAARTIRNQAFGLSPNISRSGASTPIMGLKRRLSAVNDYIRRQVEHKRRHLPPSEGRKDSSSSIYTAADIGLPSHAQSPTMQISRPTSLNPGALFAPQLESGFGGRSSKRSSFSSGILASVFNPVGDVQSTQDVSDGVSLVDNAEILSGDVFTANYDAEAAMNANESKNAAAYEYTSKLSVIPEEGAWKTTAKCLDDKLEGAEV